MTSILKIVLRNAFNFKRYSRRPKQFDIQTKFSVQQTRCFAISVTCRKRSCILGICGLRTTVTYELFHVADHRSLFDNFRR